MHSIRTKITLLNIIAIIIAIFVTTLVGCIAVANLGHSSAHQALSLLCESGKSNVNNYLKSIEQSVNTISGLVDANLDTYKDDEFNDKLPDHMRNARTIFNEAAMNTNGVLTYYYRIDPAISAVAHDEKGFWYTNLDGKGFVEHEVTDLTNVENEAVWYYTPKNTGKPVWLPPYVTDGLDVYVLSYNVPVYHNHSFVGVIGIEISYKTIGDQIKSITYSKDGYAYIVSYEDGGIIYHPYIDILSMPVDQRPAMPEGFDKAIRSNEHHIEYTFQGVNKHGHWEKLSNDMVIVVAVPTSEVNETWTKVIIQSVIIAAEVIAVFILITFLFTRRITKPLKQLTTAAEEIDNGNYKVKLDYQGNDEIGVLTKTVDKLVKNLDDYVTQLNNMAYADALTSVSNKSAFDVRMSELETLVRDQSKVPEFAIAIFDCDNLKRVNDSYGHDKGNVYLRSSSNLICRVFKDSILYRIGGDEFAAVLEGEEYKNRKALREEFLKKVNEICALSKEPWEQINISVGIARFNPDIDETAHDVFVHADHLMYEHKRSKKKQNIEE